jgi:3-keto-disaccharide hydrolase
MRQSDVLGGIVKFLAVIIVAACAADPALSVAGEKSSAEKPDKDGWIDLLAGGNLDLWQKPGAQKWHLADGVLAWQKGCGSLWTKRVFGDFTVDLEVKCAKNTNSGVYLRGPVESWHGLEVQVYHSFGKPKPGKHDMGAIYDCLEPSASAEKPIGQWNHLVITFVGNGLKVVLNDKPIVDADLDRWKNLHDNPDGTTNKFDWPIKDLPRKGHVGLQDHGTPVWYRKIRIKPLDGKG